MGFCLRSQRVMLGGTNCESALTCVSKIKICFFHILYSYKSHSASVELFEFTGEEYFEKKKHQSEEPSSIIDILIFLL